ncbi:MAG: S41 family peptidase [Planctomycetaceae bacterium]|nr:S41 family peptidase [Planctomycetaceae bacterium]
MPRRNLIVLLLAALVSLACYWRASRNRFGDTFSQAMNIVVQDYVDEVEPRRLFEGAMDGMMDQLDMYSGYTPPQEYLQFKEQIDGEFPGIGVMVEVDEKSKQLKVLVPTPGSPAAKAGLRPGDVIEAVNGHATADVPISEVVKRIKGSAGTTVTLTLRRKGRPEPLDVVIPRANIAIESVLGDVRRADGTWIFHLQGDPRIGYVRLTTFAERTADDFRRALDDAKPGQDIDGLILDMRGNEGGLLSAAVDLCDMLLDEGLIVSTRGREGVEKSSYHAKPGTDLPADFPVVVLVDRYAASASEIFAAALQDHQRAAIVGERTWGKGTVQNIEELEGGKSALRITIATYWRPSGKDIHKRRNAKDSDDWGVRADPGLEVVLAKELWEKSARTRRQRDVTPLAELEAKRTKPVVPPEKPATPQDEPATSANEPPIPVPDAAEDEPVDLFYIDPQLQKAIEVLHERIDAGAVKRT